MSLPVSQYEALLAEVRDLRRKAQRVQQLARPLLQGEPLSPSPPPGVFSRIPRPRSPPEIVFPRAHPHQYDGTCEPLDYTMESLLLGRQHSTASGSANYEPGVASSVEGSEEEYGGARSTKMSVSSEPVSHRNRGMSSLYHGTWPVERTMWNSEPASLGAVANQPVHSNVSNQMEVTSVMSFASSSGGVPLDRVLGSSPERGKWSSQQLEAKMDVVHSLLAMLGGQEHVDMGETLLALSTCPESCLAMRQSGCIPLLVQLVQSDRDGDTRQKASQALHNLVNSQPDEKLRKRECRILKLLDQCRAYTDALRNNTEYEVPESSSITEVSDGDKHPVQTVAHLMKLSFDEGHRQAICHLGGIHTIASLVEVEHTLHGSTTTENHCILLRRYACMALTNLTFGDSGNKALLCSFREFMRALVIQLQSPSDELRQVTASVLRNLSWRADSTSKEILREVGSVTGLMKAAMLDNKENTLKSILSALWNLSAHCTENKSEICAVEGALGFLVDMLTYKTPSKSMAIIENSGGILRNISSQIAVREDYREVLRGHNCLQILLDQLKSPSLTIVSNACGTLWNLSAKCGADQEALWQMGAPAMLRSLNHSKHKMIAMGSSAALKNLLSARPQQSFLPPMDTTALSLDLPALPTLGARKQKALMQDLDQNLSETYENIEKDSPIKRSEKEFLQDSRHKYEIGSRNNSNLDDEHLSNAFASLNLNEPSTSYTSDFRPKSRIPQSYGSSSLPYMTPPVKRSNPCTYIPVRNKFSDCAYEDEIDMSDQPIDYSQKYSETKLPNAETTNASSNKDFTYNQPKTEKENFSIYAETDLDQPTDYSLRYAEDDSDSDICNKITKNESQEYVQDTVKTYCTEDTPYETPFNFSTATSMSDLRMEEKPLIDNDKLKESAPKTNKEVTKNVDEKDHCSTEDISEIDNQAKLEDKIPKSELSSGLMSPEKPVNYCEEGTPGYFSRVSSFGSLNSIPANEPMKNGSKESENLVQENVQREKRVEKTSPKTPGEAKAVKFERVVNYAEETPLMFSRSSSLASLDSIEQHSIHDDRSSVVSDLSRLTSGIVSPSELPDSPTQTVPPSPKPRKNVVDFPTTSMPRLSTENRSQTTPRTLIKPSVFEDNITKFKEESTPIQFSTATSLSSLTIDDHEESSDQVDAQPPGEKHLSENSSLKNREPKEEDAEVEKKDAEKESTSSGEAKEIILDSDEERDADILAACINMGKQSVQQHSKTQPIASTSRLPLSSAKFSHQAKSTSSIALSRGSSGILLAPTNTSQSSGDTIKMYHTDTDSVSPKLQIHSNNKCTSPKRDFSSDESNNWSEDNENNLAERLKPAKNDQQRLKPMSYLPRRQGQTGNVNSLRYSATASGNSRRGSGEAGKVSRAEVNRRETSLPPYLPSRDEFESYAVENSPYHYSLRSSLSDLTVDGSVAGLTRTTETSGELQSASGFGKSPRSDTLPKGDLNTSLEQSPNQRDTSLSAISIGSLSPEAEQALLAECIAAGKPKPSPHSGHSVRSYTQQQSSLNTARVQNENEKHPLSALSLESLSAEAEEALLKECIEAGKPKANKSFSVPTTRIAQPNIQQQGAGFEQSSSAPQQRSNLNIPQQKNPSQKETSHKSSLSAVSLESLSSEAEQALLQECIEAGKPKGNSSNKPFSITRTSQSSSNQQRSDLRVREEQNTSQREITEKKSLSTLSLESLTSEAEQALLRECIEAGKPKAKPFNAPGARTVQPNNQQQGTIRVGQQENVSQREIAQSSLSALSLESLSPELEQALLRECIEAGKPKPNKPFNVPIASQTSNKLQSPSSFKQFPRSPTEQQSNLRATQDQTTNKRETSRRDYSTAISLDSLSPEAEQALLEECIAAGKRCTQASAATRPTQPSNLQAATYRQRQRSSSQQRSNLNANQDQNASQRKPSALSLESLSPEAEQALLRECIEAGKPKGPSVRPLNVPVAKTTQLTAASQFGHSSKAVTNKLHTPQKQNPNQREHLTALSLESLSSEAERALLQECIEVGKNKTAQGASLRPSSISIPRVAQPTNQLQAVSRSEQSSSRSSTQQQGNLNVAQAQNASQRVPLQKNSLSTLSLESLSPEEKALLEECIEAGKPKPKPLSVPISRSAQPSNQPQAVPRYIQSPRSAIQQRSSPNVYQEQGTSRRDASRKDSISALDIETLSPEAEQALLEECILAGKTKGKSVSPTKPINVPLARTAERRSMGKSMSRDRQLAEEDQIPKNVNAASVAESTAMRASETCPEVSPAAAGVEENPEPETGTEKRTGSPGLIREGEAGMSGTPTDTSPDKSSPTGEILSTDLVRSGSSKSLSNAVEGDNLGNVTTPFVFSPGNIDIEDCLAKSCEESRAVDNRMLDPDAMIESLDRFTAELVSQASHLNKDEDKYKISTGDNTWNDDTSPNEVTFPSISGSAPNVITFSNEEDSNKVEDAVDGIITGNEEIPSNDFSSINTTTMTESTLIAIEASKMVTVFKNEAEMSLSMNSAASLELDHVQPPSHLNSLTNSAVGLEKGIPKSPKLTARKKSIPAGLMVRRALSNSLNHGSSLESLENHSLSNLDHVNPPSDLRDVFDLEGSMSSVASLPNETDVKADFVLNGILNKDSSHSNHHPIFNVKQPFSSSNYSCELENINPPSLFNEITDFCNSLADVTTEAICSETLDIFEDCYTHTADTTLQDENLTLADETTEFSDAHSATPMLSDLSSAESTPKKTKNLTKSMTTKQRRNLARDRYKTYTIAAEMVMRQEGEKLRDSSEGTEDFRTAQETTKMSGKECRDASVSREVGSPKLTPKEKRQLNRSRFETQVLDQSITSILQQPVIETPPPSDSQTQSCDSNSCGSSPAQSPARTKLSIRRNFIQKRLENKDRFKTQTLSESSFSPDISSASPPLINGETELQFNLQKEADLVLRTLRDTKTTQDELIDCETLSLVSNDDDSEHNSGSSVNYRTYHKSWGFRRDNVPIINSKDNNNQEDLSNCQPNFANDLEPLSNELADTNLQTNGVSSESSDEESEPKTTGKPKIVKPAEKPPEPGQNMINEEQSKGIRGRRKPLYSKANLNNKIIPKTIKPVKTMTSNLVKNVTSTLKSGTALRSVANKQSKVAAVKQPVTQNRASSGYGSRTVSNSSSPKTSPARVPSNRSSPKHTPANAKQQTTTPKGTPPMERQGTFTKDDPSPSSIPKPSSKIPTPSSTSKIPAFTSKIARSVASTTSKIPNSSTKPPSTIRNGYVKSSSTDRASKNTRIYNRSTSADSREPVKKMQASPSSTSLKNELRMPNGAVKKSGIPSPAQRSNSNCSLTSNGNANSKKQVTSKIASLWKKIEDSKRQPPKKDTRLWIQPESEPEPEPSRLIRSNTFDNKDGAILRNKLPEDGDPTKRISRLGSFIIMDESEDAVRLQQAISAAATTTTTNVV